MKKSIMMIIILSLVLALPVLGAEEEKKESKENVAGIYSVFAKGDYNKVIKLTEAAMKKQGMKMELMHLKYDALMRLNRLDEALSFIDDAIEQKGESEELVSARYNILLHQKRLPEALKAAMRKDEIAKKKSPWDSMNIMHVYMRMNRMEDALDSLQEAVNRGFISYRMLMGKRYQMFKKEKRLYDIIEYIKVSIGLGNKAKGLQVKLLNGEIWNLGRQKGKVILLDFWALWCDGCRRDKPQLKRTYDMFKHKGFEIVGISLDTSQTKLKEYVAKYKLDWKHACSGEGWEDQAVKRYAVNNLPSYWLIDKKGVLRAYDLKDQDLRKAIAELLAEK